MEPPIAYVPPPAAAKNAWVKPVLIGCGSLFVLVVLVCGIGTYLTMRAVGTALHNSGAAQVAQNVAASAQQAEQQAAQQAQAGASPGVADGAAAGIAVLKTMVGGGKAHVDTLTRDELKTYLPETVNGLARTNSESHSGSFSGISGTSASANYGTGATTVSIDVTDAANMTGLTTMMGLAMGVESEDDNGYEKAVQLGDTKVHEKWTSSGKSAELVGIVGRFMVDVTSSGVEMSDAEKAFQAVDIAKLESVAATTPATATTAAP